MKEISRKRTDVTAVAFDAHLEVVSFEAGFLAFNSAYESKLVIDEEGVSSLIIMISYTPPLPSSPAQKVRQQHRNETKTHRSLLLLFSFDVSIYALPKM